MVAPETQLEAMGGVRHRALTVGTSEVQVILSPNEPTRGVLLQAATGNTNSIFLGATGLTTSDFGVELIAGASLPWDGNLSLGEMYAISDAAAQTLTIIAGVDKVGQ